MNPDNYALGIMLLSVGWVVGVALLFTGVVLVCVLVDGAVTTFRRLRRWHRRRVRRRLAKVRVLREGVQVKLRVNLDASTLGHEAAGLAEPWPQKEPEVDAWVGPRARDVPADR